VSWKCTTSGIVSIRDRYVPFTRRGKGGVGFAYLPSKSWIELGPLVIVDYFAEGLRLPFRVQARRLDREVGSEAIDDNDNQSRVDWEVRLNR